MTITAFNQKGTLYFSASIQKGELEIASTETVNLQELKDFLKKNEFHRYEAHKINPKYFNLMEQIKKELYGEKSKKINSQRRILILLKRLFVYEEALDLNELAEEFNVSHLQRMNLLKWQKEFIH